MIKQYVVQPECLDCKHRTYREVDIHGDTNAIPSCKKGHDDVVCSIFTTYDCPDKEEKE